MKGVLFLIKSTITILDSSVSKYSSFLHRSPTSTSTKKRYLYLFVILYMFCYIPYIWLRFENLLRVLTSHVMWHDQPCYVAWPAISYSSYFHQSFIIYLSYYCHIIVIWLSYIYHMIVILLSYDCHNIVIWLSYDCHNIVILIKYFSSTKTPTKTPTKAPIKTPAKTPTNSIHSKNVKIIFLFKWATKVKGSYFCSSQQSLYSILMRKSALLICISPLKVLETKWLVKNFLPFYRPHFESKLTQDRCLYAQNRTLHQKKTKNRFLASQFSRYDEK